MTDHNDKNEDLLKLAKAKINFSLTLLAFAVAGILLLIYSPNFSDKADVEISEITSPEEEAKVSIVDPSEIVDGIHVPSGLIANEGFELVLTTCSSCHSIDLVTQNCANEAGWKEMIVWMQETQGLWDLGENEAPIIKYLATNYPAKKAGRRKNLEGIEWYELK